MRRLVGYVLWAASILLVSAPLVTGLGEAGCGGCPGKSCLCADGTTQPTANAPCTCYDTCASHGGFCNEGICPKDAAADGASDAAADVVSSDSSPDGGLQSGDSCDLQNDQCAPGLKCCTEPTHIVDASTHDICAPIQDGGTCPMYP